MLIARQKPAATRVAGIRTWNSLGRFVKRGEKGILILAPMVGRKKPTDEIATEVESDNAADERKPQQQLYGFRAVYVFDRLSRDLWAELLRARSNPPVSPWKPLDRSKHIIAQLSFPVQRSPRFWRSQFPHLNVDCC